MKCIVKFKDGYICEMELIHNWDRLHMYRTDDSYLLVPYADVEIGRVEMEEFLQGVQDAKMSAPLGEADLGKVLGGEEVKKPKPIVWKEVSKPKKEIKWKEVGE